MCVSGYVCVLRSVCSGVGWDGVRRILVINKLIHLIPLYVFSIKCHLDSEQRDDWKFDLKMHIWIPSFTWLCYSKHSHRIHRSNSTQGIWLEFMESIYPFYFRTFIWRPWRFTEGSRNGLKEGKEWRA